ncbi:MAG: prolyl oligopeptidase family serine peptidase [Candidatus Bathyarchaeum sp.]|nr:MAG: prolyl oligopeptidase family serine peptidase [Candidatus Bathyarchaeum sp.]
MNKTIRRLSLVFSVVLMVSVIVGAQFVTAVSAKKRIEIYYPVGEYTQIIGTLENADYEILIPDEWNGMLVVACRGYTHDFPYVPFPPTEMPHALIHLYGLGFVDAGFAWAWSSYGEGGFCIKEAMIRTHQMTEYLREYLIENYDVPEKVFLWGFSMGGAVACLLGEKYPDLYSGVLDICGVKDLEEIYWLASMAGSTEHVEDLEAECGGSPEEKPQAYERRSPIDNPEVSIPIIVIHGTADPKVPFYQSVNYNQTVNDATEPDLCKLYPIPGEGHGGPISWGFALVVALPELVAWSNSLDP